MLDSRPYPRHSLWKRIVLYSIVAYFLPLGGTFTGLIDPALQQISLSIVTLGIGVWLLVRWRRPLTPQINVILLAWIAALAISSLGHLSSRVEIGLWYAGFYLGVWLVLADLRRRGLPGCWITDSALIVAIPIMLFALVQVIPWFPKWAALDEVRVAFIPPRPTSIYGNPNTLGAVLAMLIPLALVRARWSARQLDRILWGIWLVFGALILYLTYSRGAWLAGAAALVTLGALTLRRTNRRNPLVWWSGLSRQKRVILLAAGSSMVAILLILAAAALSAFDTPRREPSLRFAIYGVALDEFRAHPLTGTGLFTFGRSILEHYSVPPDQPHAHAHSLILNVAAELGLPGLIALALTLGAVVIALRRALLRATTPAQWAHTAACCSALAAFGAQGLVDVTIMVPAVMLLVLAIFGAVMLPAASVPAPRYRGRLAWMLTALLWAIVLITGWWSVRIYGDYIEGQGHLVRGEYERGAAVLQEVAAARPGFALYHAAYAYACGLAASDGNTALLRSGITAYRQALDIEPPHAVWWANLAALYWQAGERDHALSAMQQAVFYAPDDPDLWLNLGIFYEQTGQKTQAERAYRTVLDLAPRWGQVAHFWSATPLRREVLAAGGIEPAPLITALDLWRRGQHKAALDVLRTRVSRDPAQPGPYIQIARLYVAVGQPDRARANLDAANVLVHTEYDLAWIRLAEAELARARGDDDRAAQLMAEARTLLWPDATGYPLFYGREVANYHFLHDTLIGVLLPQLTILGPDPPLTDLLWPGP